MHPLNSPPGATSPKSTDAFEKDRGLRKPATSGEKPNKPPPVSRLTPAAGAPSHNMDALHNLEDDDKISRWQISPSVLVVLQQVYSSLPAVAGFRRRRSFPKASYILGCGGGGN